MLCKNVSKTAMEFDKALKKQLQVACINTTYLIFLDNYTIYYIDKLHYYIHTYIQSYTRFITIIYESPVTSLPKANLYLYVKFYNKTTYKSTYIITQFEKLGGKNG